MRFSIRPRTGPCCPSFTSPATRSPIPLFWAGCLTATSSSSFGPTDTRPCGEREGSEGKEGWLEGGGGLGKGVGERGPGGPRRMGANPHANGGLIRRELRLPDFRSYAVKVASPGMSQAEPTRIAGALLRDVVHLNADNRNFRLLGPDETSSNRLDAVFEATDRVWMERLEPYDVHLSRQGRVIEVLSEHICQGWLEGYLLTGRHGLFSCYEAFIHIVDSMFNQHAKWLKVARTLAWRRPLSSLNYLLTSHWWCRDHNGVRSQDPSVVDVVVNKKADIVRVYFP